MYFRAWDTFAIDCHMHEDLMYLYVRVCVWGCVLWTNVSGWDLWGSKWFPRYLSPV